MQNVCAPIPAPLAQVILHALVAREAILALRCIVLPREQPLAPVIDWPRARGTLVYDCLVAKAWRPVPRPVSSSVGSVDSCCCASVACAVC